MTDSTATPLLMLAAGRGDRWRAAGGRGPKLLADVDGRTLLQLSLAEARAAGWPDVHVTVAGDELETAQRARDLGADVTIVVDAALGMHRSLQTGLASLGGAGGVLVVLADDPLACRALPDVASEAARHPDQVVAVRRDAAAPHPVYLPEQYWNDERAGRGMRAWLEEVDVRWVESDAPDPIDVNVPADIARLAAALT